MSANGTESSRRQREADVTALTKRLMRHFEGRHMCHECAHAIAEGQISAQVSARDLTIRELRVRANTMRTALRRAISAMTIMRLGATDRDKAALDDHIAECWAAMGEGEGGKDSQR